MIDTQVIVVPKDLEAWRASIEQRVYRHMLDSGSRHGSARRLAKFEADRQLEAEIARVALHRYSFAGEARERARMSEGIKDPDIQWCLDYDQTKGVKGKGGKSGGRKRRKPAPKIDPNRRFGFSAA